MESSTAKLLSMVTLGMGSFFVGILPMWLSPLSKQRCPLFLSCMLCLGGGVLLATSLLHMLPEARETLPNHSEIALCGGFLLIYFVDEMVHFLCGDKIDVSSSAEERKRRRVSQSGSWLTKAQNQHGHSHRNKSYGATENEALLGVSGCSDEHHSREPDPCHVNHDEPCMKSNAGFIGLVMALFIHSVLEGLAIGLENVSRKVLLLLAAVSCHKFVVGFCLGVELSVSTREKIWTHVTAVLIFSLGSVAGIGAGMLLEVSTFEMTNSTLGALQALAAGTLLYVTVSEVLPRERAKWHHGRHYAGLVQLSSTLIGFTLMYILSKLLG